MTTIMQEAGSPEAPTLLQDASQLTEHLMELLRVVQFRDRDRACCYGLSVSQCYALEAVVRSGPLTVNDLAAALYLDKSTASRLARGLTDRGLLLRERDVGDGRTVRLVATPEGQSTANRIHTDLVTEYAALIADFPAEVRAAAAQIVGRLATAVGGRIDASGGTCCIID